MDHLCICILLYLKLRNILKYRDEKDLMNVSELLREYRMLWHVIETQLQAA